MVAMKVALVGTGLIGLGWAIVFARAGHQVALYDADPRQADSALRRIREILPELSRLGLIGKGDDLAARLTICDSLEAALAGAAYVQESGPERLQVKRAIFADLDRIADPRAVIATSSSGIRISAIVEGLEGRSRCLVAHPANPPYLLPIVEIVPAGWTAPEVVRRVQAFLEDAGQVTVLLNKEIDGFVLNRLQGALLHEAFRLVEDGVATADDVDKTVREGLGLRWSFMGPFETIDLNAPEGLADYVDRLGQMYLDFALQRGAPGPWPSELVETIERQRRSLLSKAELPKRTAWRDRRLMALAVHKAQADEGPGS